MKIPENNVEIRSNDGGGVELLLDGYDLAPHTTDWTVGMGPDGVPVLTVTIPCKRIVMDVEEVLRTAPSVNATGIDGEALAAAIRRARETLGEVR